MDQLDWLPSHPDLAGAISTARKGHDPVERLATGIRLAGYRRDFVATERLDRLVNAGFGSTRGEKAASLGLRPLRLALLASHTGHHPAAGIRVAGRQGRCGIGLAC